METFTHYEIIIMHSIQVMVYIVYYVIEDSMHYHDIVHSAQVMVYIVYYVIEEFMHYHDIVHRV